MTDTRMIETLNINETTELLRSLGMKISPETLQQGIEQGIFPFGSCVRSKKGNPVYFIYRVFLDQWISERAGRKKEVAAK